MVSQRFVWGTISTFDMTVSFTWKGVSCYNDDIYKRGVGYYKGFMDGE